MDATATLTRAVTIRNQRGLHARAAAKFVKLANDFEADIQVRRGELSANGRSIMGLMMLAAGPGTTITVEATGPQAAEVIEALAALVTGRFTEGE